LSKDIIVSQLDRICCAQLANANVSQALHSRPTTSGPVAHRYGLDSRSGPHGRNVLHHEFTAFWDVGFENKVHGTSSCCPIEPERLSPTTDLLQHFALLYLHLYKSTALDSHQHHLCMAAMQRHPFITRLIDTEQAYALQNATRSAIFNRPNCVRTSQESHARIALLPFSLV
jgi:hypothetical protein